MIDVNIIFFRDLESAIELYEKCLTINPKNASTYLSLGFSYHLKEQFREALNCYHKASFLKNDETLIEELVNRALADINEFPIEDSYLRESEVNMQKQKLVI